MKKGLLLLSLILLSVSTIKAQTALDFDGANDYVLTPAITHGNQFTYEGWFNTTEASPGWSGLITTKTTGNIGDWIQLALNPGGSVLVELADDYDVTTYLTSINATTVINNNGWHHVAFVYDGTTMLLYIDGVLEASSTINKTINISRQFHVMAERALSLYTQGIADDIRIWNVARSVTEINTDMGACLTGGETGLIALYDMEDGSPSAIATDITANTFDGVLTNMDPVTDWVGGVVCSAAPTEALVFDGTNDIVSTTTNVGIEDICDAGFTMEAWVYQYVNTGVRSIIRKTGDYNLYALNGGLYAEIWPDATTNMIVVSGPAITTGAWTHVAFAWDGANGNFFVNGTQTAGTNAAPSGVGGVADLNIGDSQSFSGQVWNGEIDEVRIWTCVKSQAEVAADMSAAHTGAEPGLALFYDFSDGAGATVTDLSVNGNDGTLINGPTWVAGVATAGAPTFAGCVIPFPTISAPTCQPAADNGGLSMEHIGNYLYISNWSSAAPVQDSRISIYDVTVPGTATYVSSEDHGQAGGVGNGAMLDMDTDGTYLYGASRYREEFYVIDYANPINLNVIGTVALDPGPSAIPSAMKVDGTNVFVIDNWGKMYTIDVTVPATPTITSTFAIAGNPTDIEIEGTIAYVANTTGLLVIDISTPTAPVLLSTITDAANYYRVYKVGSYLYAASGADLYTYDISTPTAPALQGGPLTLANAIYDFDVNNNELYIGTYANGNVGALTLLDITVPSAPILADEAASAVHRGKEIIYDNGFVYSIDDFLTDELCIYGAVVAPGNDHYWVGGTGDWSDDANHWANTSGGIPGSSTVPTFGNNAIFDDNSGLTAVDIVNIDVDVEVDTLTFAAVSNSFVYNGNGNIITVEHSLLGNPSGVTFTGTWGDVIFKPSTAGEIITSGGTTWEHNFRIDSTEAITLTDNLDITTGTMFVDRGGLLSAGFDLACTQFESTAPNIRTIDFTGSDINVTGGTWDVDPTTLTLLTGASTIFLGDNAGLASFTGGALIYDTLRSISATNLDYFGDNTFALFEIPVSSNLQINDGDILATDSLIASGTCGTPTTISTIGAGASGVINKTGTPSLFLSGVQIDNVDALLPGAYNILLSDTTNGADNWTKLGSTFYWIADGGDWSDFNHWSLSTGGPVSGCVPDVQDTVIFDNLSFTGAGEVVLIDTLAQFSKMDWTTTAFPSTLELDTNIVSYGDVTFYPDLYVTRDSLQHVIQFVAQADFNPSTSYIDCNIANFMTLPGDSLVLFDNLTMSDSSSILMFNGEFYTQGNDISTGSMITVNDPSSSLDQRLIDLDASAIDLKVSFQTKGDTTLMFNAGTSSIYIGDTVSFKNSLETEGLTFNDVTLNFSEQTINFPATGTPVIQQVYGNNTYERFEIVKGSHVYLDSNSIQTVNDSLIFKGNCMDSIFISTTDTATLTQAYINMVPAVGSVIECNNLSGINNSGTALTALFSTDVTTNTNWTFSTSQAITANFTADGPFCWEDTTLFSDLTTTYDGGSYTTQWYYSDTSTGYFLNPPTDSTWINFEVDTLQHVFLVSGDLTVEAVTIHENYCTDTLSLPIHINRPIVALIPSESDTQLCDGDSIYFEANGLAPNMTFQFFLNGVAQNAPPTANDTLYATNSLVDQDTVGLLAYENGCVIDSMVTIVYDVAPLPSFTWTPSPTATICDGDTTAFVVTPDVLADTTHYTYQFLIDGSSVAVTSVGFYATDTLNNSDIVSVIVKDSLSCADTLFTTITVNPVPTTSLAESIGGNVICDGDLVTFTASGANTYEFFIDGVSQGAASATTTFSSSTLATGDTVTVIGYSTSGCPKQAPEEYFYTVNPLPITTMTLSDADTSICSGDIVVFNAGGASLYEFFINGTSQGPASATNILNTSTLVDEDTVVVEGTFSGCTQFSDSAIFEVITSPTTTLVSDLGSTICQEDEVTFTASGATNYEFFVDGASQGPSSPTSTFVSSTITNGQTITVEGESNTCVIAQSINFNVLSIPSVGLFSDDPDNTICDGDPITLTGANANSYDLYVNDVFVSTQVAPAFVNPTLPVGSNSVYLIGTGANGCSDTSQTVLTIDVNPIPTINLTSSDVDDIICAGESVTFTGTGSTNYQFFVDGIPQGSMSTTDNLTTTNLLHGQVVQITGSTLGCTNTSNTITMTVNPIPAVTLSSTDVDNVYCEGSNVDYTANGATNYEFFVDGVSQGPASPTNTLNALGFTPGSYSVDVVGESANCSNTATNMITVNALPVATISSSDVDNIICSGESVTYTANGGNLYEFFVDGVSQGVASPINTFNTTTLANSNTVSVDVISATGCSSSDGLTPITVNTTPTVAIASSDIDFQICLGDNVDFTGSGATDYEFFINGVSQGAASPTAVLSTTTLANGDVISVEGTSNNCSAISSDLTFVVYGAPVVSLVNNTDNTLCVGENTDLIASGATNYQFLVNGTPVGGFAPATNFNSPLNNGDVVTVMGETNGCVSTSLDNFTYTVYTYPTLSSSTSTGTTICLNDLVDFTASGAMTYDFDLNGTILQSGATSTLSLNDLVDGDVLTITGFNGDCASADDIYTFTVNSMNLDLTVAPSSMICEGDLVTFTATGADQYEFFLNGTSVGPMGAGNTYSSGTFSDMDEITFTGYNNTTMCTQPYDDYTIMNVIDEPTITALSNTDFCEGDSVVLVSNAIYGNQWYLDGVAIPGANDTSYVAYTPGVYSLGTTSGGLGDVWSFGQNAAGTFGSGDNFNNSEPTVSIATLGFDQLTSGYDFVLGVSTTDELYAWGDNASGQLGDGTYTSTNTPQMVPTLTGIQSAATSESSSMAVTTTGDVYVWGNNTEGQLATGNTSVINFPFLNAALANTDTIAGGRNHFIILRNDGTVWAVGNNDYGQLGQGNLSGSMSAIQVPGLANVVSVGAGEYHSFAIDNLGDMYVWGNNGSGQLGLNDLNSRLDPTLSPLRNVVNAQGGATHSAFLTTDNKVYTSGGNSFGQLGIGNYTDVIVPTEASISGATMISTGQYTTLVKRADNSVFGFGNNTEEQLSSPSGLTVNTPEHITDLDGVQFIEASKSSSHFIYGEDQSCTSQDVNVNTLTVPAVTITANVDTLSTIAGDSYQWYFNGNPIPGATSQTYEANESGDYHVEVTFANGCTGTSPVYVHSMSAIQEIGFGTVNVYPNPTNNLVNIAFSEQLSNSFIIELRDQTGRIVFSENYNQTSLVSIDLTAYENGIYYVTISNSEVSGNVRIIKTSK